MKLVASFALFLSGVTAQSGGRRHNSHLWLFGENGVKIYTPDGATEVKTIPPEKVCKETFNDDGSTRVRCDFNDVVSDGKKYVWATVARGVPMVDIFRIETGDHVGSFATCGSPGMMDYHPLREEVWVHCDEFSNSTESHVDVFSAVSPAASIPATITLHDNTALRSRGKLLFAANLGDVAYSTVYGQPYLYKIDMAQRSVKEQYDMALGENERFYGVYDMVYSPKNSHIFVRAEVCCTCGEPDSDVLECGRYGSSNITLTVDGSDVIKEGQCGRHCRGGPADTIGIIEFDTATGKKIGQHNFVGTAPVYAPFASPDGEHIILFGMNGGKTVEILKAGSSGFKSSLGATLNLDFNTTNVGDDNVFDDFAYIQQGDLNLFVVASSNDYKVAIVDMDSTNKDASYITLKDVPYEGRARTRQIEHVEGSDYVWIGGREQDEAFVVNVATKQLVRSFTEIDARKLLSVTHHAFYEQVSDFGEYLGQTGADSGAMVKTVEDVGVSSTSSAKSLVDDNETSSSNDALSIAALALSCIAIAAVLASFMAKKNEPPKSESLPLTTQEKDDPSVAVPPSVN